MPERDLKYVERYFAVPMSRSARVTHLKFLSRSDSSTVPFGDKALQRLKIIYLKQAGADPLWDEVTTSTVGAQHDVRVYDPQQPANSQLEYVDTVIDMGGSGATQELVDAAKNAKLWQIVTVGYGDRQRPRQHSSTHRQTPL